MNYALDACAMIAYLRGETGGTVVDGFLKNPTDTCYAHSINLLEVYYDFIRKHDEPSARQALKDLVTAGVIIRRDMSQPFVYKVGQLKALTDTNSGEPNRRWRFRTSLRYGADSTTPASTKPRLKTFAQAK